MSPKTQDPKSKSKDKSKKKDKGKDKKDKKKAKASGPTQAELADRYDLYQQTVQCPEEDVKFMQKVFKDEFGRLPTIFREDFCGTAWACCEWVKASPRNVAYGIDLDPEPMNWGKEHNLSELKQAERDRITLIEGNALDGGTPPADIVSALNFSYFCFQERELLKTYFRRAFENVAEEGLLVLDMEGGWEALGETSEEREEDGYTYVWEQEEFDAITHRALCSINFLFDDGSEMKRAFTYDWRIWTVPELRDVLLEVGFEAVDVYWEGWDEELEEGDGVFTKTAHAENCESWIAYVVATKRKKA